LNKEDYNQSSPSTENELIAVLKDKAYRLLARREYSVYELRQKFKTLAQPHICDQVLAEMVDQGVQSDRRFAEMLGRSRFNAGKGPVKLKHELNEHKIDSLIIESIMDEYSELWTESAKLVRLKKFGETPPANFNEWAKQARFLQQRGFTPEHIGNFESPASYE
jgi:regulatory protein